MFDSVMDNRNLGYWHIGQVYNMQTKFAAGTVPTDDMEMTRGQLLQVNFAPVWHGRVIGEMEMITKRILTQDRAIMLNPTPHLENLSEWLLETRTESSVWFDLTMWALQMSSAAADLAIVGRIGRFITAHLTNLPARRAVVLGAGPAPRDLHVHTGGNAAMSFVDELQDPAEPADLSGTAGAAAGAGEISADEAAPAKRFKKSAPEAVEPAAVEPAAVAPAASSLSTTAPADASGWDFEQDLEKIFAQTPGEKPRGKAKSKGAQ
jgi:hypothetical protein